MSSFKFNLGDTAIWDGTAVSFLTGLSNASYEVVINGLSITSGKVEYTIFAPDGYYYRCVESSLSPVVTPPVNLFTVNTSHCTSGRVNQTSGISIDISKFGLDRFGLGEDVSTTLPKSPTCDCGGDKANTSHARWCTVYESID